MDLLNIGFGANVGLALAWLLGAFVAMVATALVVALLIGVPPLLFGFVRRVRRRYKAFKEKEAMESLAPSKLTV